MCCSHASAIPRWNPTTHRLLEMHESQQGRNDHEAFFCYLKLGLEVESVASLSVEASETNCPLVPYFISLVSRLIPYFLFVPKWVLISFSFPV